MNTLVDLAEDKFTLSDEELLKKVDKMTDKIYAVNDSVRLPSHIYRHIPARPNEDYDLLVGRLIRKFQQLQKEKDKLKKAGLEATNLIAHFKDQQLGGFNDVEQETFDELINVFGYNGDF